MEGGELTATLKLKRSVAEEKWKEYLFVGCLRNHAVINQIPQMEQIYVHAKLMIVDDR